MGDATDRRAAERMAVGQGTTCSLAAPVTEDFGAARIRDVSLDGVGLTLTRKVEVGALLAVVLANPGKGFSKTALVRVAHVTAVPGGFSIGGTFATPLTYQELTTLVM